MKVKEQVGLAVRLESDVAVGRKMASRSPARVVVGLGVYGNGCAKCDRRFLCQVFVVMLATLVEVVCAKEGMKR